MKLFKKRLEDKNLQLALANKTKGLLLSVMSREIRAPLEGIIFMSETARENMNDREKVDHCLMTISAESKRLHDTLHNLLDISKIECGILDLDDELIYVPDLLNILSETMNKRVERKSQKLNLRIGKIEHEYILGDHFRILQIFKNILSNALRYTPEGGAINITVIETTPVKDGCARFLAVCDDNGPGMSAEVQEHLFDGLSRENPIYAGSASLSLGLLICKNLIEMMNGKLTIESRENVGTSVTVELEFPLGSPSEAYGPDKFKHSNDIDFSGRHILAAEDNELNREIVAEFLAPTNAVVDFAVDGRSCLEKFADSPENHYSLILMDVQMPIMTGCGATVAIRALNRADSKTIPIIAMTANALPEDVREVLAAGMDSHIAKPFAFDEAMAILNRFILKGRSR